MSTAQVVLLAVQRPRPPSTFQQSYLQVEELRDGQGKDQGQDGAGG